VLDHELVKRLVPWPQIGVELFNRGTRRAHNLAVSLAISHHQRVDDRLMLTLWHLAERWGRVRKEGIVVPLPLSHQRLADLVGAHRPSVTTAMGELARAGSLSRSDDGHWVLHGAPPAQLRNHRLATAVMS
jgi:CRP/FNR family transcriptional regulator, cyclic AMP receptor protein